MGHRPMSGHLPHRVPVVSDENSGTYPLIRTPPQAVWGTAPHAREYVWNGLGRGELTSSLRACAFALRIPTLPCAALIVPATPRASLHDPSVSLGTQRVVR